MPRLTQEQHDILAHVVADPQAWAAHALETVGQSAIDDKVERWRAEYQTESAKAGYMNRAQRDEQAALDAAQAAP